MSAAKPAWWSTGWLAIGLFAVALFVYWGTAIWFEKTATPDEAYFNYLAQAFLAGRLHLLDPPATHDLTPYAGRWYVPFPPLPALLMTAWVWLAGLKNVQTVLFCAIFGALNVALLYLLLQALAQRKWTGLSTTDNLWLTLLFGLGSVHWYMATTGSVWFVSQICTVTFVTLAVWSTVANNSPWLAGLALGFAMAARPTVVFTWPLLVGIAAMQARQPDGQIDWRSLSGWAVASAVSMALSGAGLLAYNTARFGDPFDFGYLTENVAPELADNLRIYGQFHPHYAVKNFWAMWLAGPQWDAETNRLAPNPEGMSLLLTTPALIYLGRARHRSALTVGAWLAFGLLLIPLLLYYNTGWWQFGYRFSLDFMPPVMVLLAIAAGNRVTGALRGLILVGVLVNLYGVVWWHG